MFFSNEATSFAGIYTPDSSSYSALRKAEGNAAERFERSYTAASLSNLWARLTGQDRHPLELHSVAEKSYIRGQRYIGLQAVRITEICGSEGRCTDFDAAFRPLHTHDRQRWVSIATAYKLGATLPPVELIKVGDAYFVRDGHHRISVARAHGQGFIDAVVTVWQVNERLA